MKVEVKITVGPSYSEERAEVTLAEQVEGDFESADGVRTLRGAVELLAGEAAGRTLTQIDARHAIAKSKRPVAS